MIASNFNFCFSVCMLAWLAFVSGVVATYSIFQSGRADVLQVFLAALVGINLGILIALFFI